MIVLEASYAALIGLMVGSFLNVVIYRLPRAIIESTDASLGCLLWPASAAPCCGHTLSWRENIPVFSWLMLRGRCGHCAAPITPRYLLVEVLTSIAFGVAAWRFGLGSEAIVYALLMALAIALFFIDIETFLLPDRLTLAMLWLGLLAGTLGYLPVSLVDSVWGACLGFMLPWSINQLYRLVRGHDGFGGGDFKLLAALGAWTGWVGILPILCAASIVGLLVVGLNTLGHRRQLAMQQAFAFGPYLIVSGLGVLLVSLSR